MSRLMDRSPIKLSTRHQAPPRTVGDPPNLGRVDRAARDISKGSKRKSRSGHRSSRLRRERGGGKAAKRLTALIFLAAILIIVGTLAFWSDKRQQQSVQSEFEELSRQRFVERIESKFASPTEDQSHAIVTAALAAKDEAAVSANFRLNGTPPADVLEFLRQEEELFGPAHVESWIGSIDCNNTLVESVLVHHTKNGISEARIAMLTPDEQGVWRLDFESFAKKCEPTWETFVSGEATEGIVRIWFSQDNYFNGIYTDDSEWLCFSMASLDSDVLLYGYCRKNSPQGTAMASIKARTHARGKKNISTFRATLAISRSEGANKRQFEIKKVLAEDWLLTDKAFDGSPGPLE